MCFPPGSDFNSAPPTDPSISFRKFQKPAVRASKLFRTLQLSSKKFTRNASLVKVLRPNARLNASKIHSRRRAARSKDHDQHLNFGLPAIRNPQGCEGTVSAQGRGEFEGSGQGRSPLRSSEHNENIARSCQEIVLRPRARAFPAGSAGRKDGPGFASSGYAHGVPVGMPGEPIAEQGVEDDRLADLIPAPRPRLDD